MWKFNLDILNSQSNIGKLDKTFVEKWQEKLKIV